MPIFVFKGRDRVGNLQTGTRTAHNAEGVSSLLLKEGITPVSIKPSEASKTLWQRLNVSITEEKVDVDALGIFFTPNVYTH